MRSSALNKYFKLSIEGTEEVLRKYIKPYYDISYSIRQSEQSNSIYITFYGKGAEKIVRLSDHPGKYLTYHYISKRTRVKKIVGILKNALKSLDILCFNKRMEELQYA